MPLTVSAQLALGLSFLRLRRRPLKLLEGKAVGMAAAGAAGVVVVAATLLQGFEGEGDLFALDGEAPTAAIAAKLHGCPPEMRPGRVMKGPLARRRDVFLSGIKAFSSRS
jgi:hypothetical protein